MSYSSKPLSGEAKAKRAKARAKSVEQAISAGIDNLPDSAHVRLPVVQSIFACSPATVWRAVKVGRIPAPKHFGPRLCAWNVGELRAALSAPSLK